MATVPDKVAGTGVIAYQNFMDEAAERVAGEFSFDDVEEELRRMEEFRKAQAEVEKQTEKKAVTQKMFKVV